MKRTPRIASIGDLTIDRYIGSGETKLGGAALNISVWIKRLGAQPAIFSSVGSDESASLFIQKIKKERIDSCVQQSTGSTSSIEILVNAQGERRYGTWNPGTLAHYHLRSADIQQLRQTGAVSITVYPQFIHILDELKKIQKKPFTVINYGDMKEFDDDVDLVESYIHTGDLYVFGLQNDSDEALIRSLKQLAKTYGKMMLITLGSHGSVLYNGNSSYVQTAHTVPVVDTTGAGDAFLAGFLVEYCHTRNIQKSLASGASTAADAITRIGAY